MLKTIDLKNPINLPPLITKLLDFKVRFSVFGDINVGDKLGKNEQGYFIQEKGNLQKFKRWWYNESRDKTFKYLDNDYIEFFSYCTSISNSVFIPIANGIQLKSELLELKAELVELINSIIQGIYNLKKTYETEKDLEAEKLKCKIDSIIFTLIDVKQMFTKDNTSVTDGIRPKTKNTISSELAGSF